MSAIAKLYASLGLETKQFDQGLKGAQSQLATFGKGLKQLDSTLGRLSGGLPGLVAGYGTFRFGQMIFDMAQASAQSMRLEQSFMSLAAGAGQSGQEMLRAMREASRGMIDDTSLIQAANRAMLLGVADTGDELSQLLEIARVRGQAMGLTLTQAFNDIVTGIGRESQLILDNLGIVVDAQRAYENYAKSIGKVADALTDAERKQAFLNAVVESSRGLVANAVDDQAASFEKFDASWKNLKDNLGRLIVPIVAPVLSDTARAVGDLNAAIADDKATIYASNQGMAAEAVARTEESIRNYEGELRTATGLEKLWIQFLLNRASASLEAQQAVLDDAAAINSAAKVAADLEAANENLNSSFFRSVGAADAEGAAIQGLVGIFEQARIKAQETRQAIVDIGTASSGRLQSGFLSIVGDVGAEKAFQMYTEANKQLEAQNLKWQETEESTEWVNFQTRQLEENLLGPIEQIREMNRGLSNTASTASNINQEFESLVGQVQGVLSGALDVGVGVNPDDFLPRQDAVNEDARRLADIAVNGWSSPWVQYFRDEFPALWAQFFEGTAGGGDIQAQAAQLLRDFQDGLRPELLDKERAKDLVRRAILGDANITALANEIAAELAQEQGIAFQQAQQTAQQVLGAGGPMMAMSLQPQLDMASTQIDTEGLVASFSAGVISSMEGEGLGGRMISVLIIQLAAQLQRVKTAGQGAGESWGTGFLETVGSSVPPALIDLLTNLVTPGVMARINQRGSMMGTTP